jgi:type VI secretion system secreted protein Hcp
MAMECALFYVDGGDAGEIKGDNTIQARADSSEIVEVHHEIRKPTDVHSGRASGARVHGPLRVLKRLDRATPLLFKALVMNATIGKMELRWYRPDPAGTGEIVHYYTITLEQVAVSKCQAWLPNTQNQEVAHYSSMEWIEFNYQKVTETWIDGGIEHMDEWQSQTV